MKHVPPPTGTPIAGPELTQDSISPELAAQQRARIRALRRLRRLREKARIEINRLLDFLDASDIDPDLEDVGDREDVGDDEPSLGSIERHPSCHAMDGRNSSGDQTHWAAGEGDDVEDEHDGAEPDEDGEPSLGWTTSGVLGGLSDFERDAAESGIGDHDGLMEQIGTNDWTAGRGGMV